MFSCPRIHALIFTLVGILLPTEPWALIEPAASSANTAQQRSVISPQLPLLFEENRGQFGESVDYVARGKGYSVVLGQQPVIELYRFKTSPARIATGFDVAPPGHVEIEGLVKVRINILGARTDITPTPLEQQQALTHYLTGEPSAWSTDIPNFNRVRYDSLLENIDVEYYGREGRLEYDFVVQPGGDPASIKLKFEGAQGISINEQGNLVIDLGTQEIVQQAPVSYQLDSNGERTAILSSYIVNEGVIGFQVAALGCRQNTGYRPGH